ncbi:site-specific DNA recombinase [Sporomusaceae bacterium BoRhaA]|uniref:recombinase family protein n=1 Tax=Pelorhabdus rhamnosifermentans TaxID=2772457 RepID=UPI001C064401|nr:recombinase family protein [Pelorhabdus rhamnosifermentans]MBU2702122.1 site-specific DNA recombinase [Pelorhabdus rhamnosifermentans]
MAKAIYCRVSTEDQAKRGYSLSDQAAACKAFLVKQGETNIIEYIDDGYSGEFIDRPALTRLRDDVAAGSIESVVVYDPDRLARKLSIQLLVAEEIEKSKVALHFVTGDYDASPDGRLFFSMRGAIAEFEKAKILDRTLRGKRKKASQGKIIMDFGLFGYDYDKKNCSYIINKGESEVVQKIFYMATTNNLSVQGIQKELNRLVIPSPTGKYLWPTSSIHNLLTNMTYTGTFISMKKRYKKVGIKTKIKMERPKDEWISIPVPPIIDKITFERVQQHLKANKATPRKPLAYPFLLSGILFCGVCGCRMLTHHCLFRNGTYKAYYQCATQRYANRRNAGITCESRTLPADAIDTDLWNKLLKAIYNPAELKKFMSKNHKKADNGTDLLRLISLEGELIKRRETIAKWFRQQMLSEEEAEKELSEIKTQLTGIQERKNILKPPESKEMIVTPSLEETFNKLRPLIESGNELNPEEKKQIIHALLSKVTITRTDHHQGKGARKKLPEFKISWETI